MKSHYLGSKTGRFLLALFFLVGLGMVSTASAQNWPYNQDPYRRDRDRDYRRDDRHGRNGGYGNQYQIATSQGYQDGLYTGSSDGQRGQNYNPQRSHFYRNGHGDNGGYGNYGRSGSYQFQQAYRDGFLRGYNDGYRRYSNRRRGNERYNNRWPFPF
ncbi:MAG: hypothetical protein ABR607_10715 [Pyrinomonadaceae bacterium]